MRVHTTGEAQVSVTIEEEAEKKSDTRRRTLSEDDFFSEIADDTTKMIFRRILSFASEIGAVLTWRSSGVSIQLLDPNGSRQNLTLFVLTNAGLIYTGWLSEQLEKISLDKNISYDYVKALSTLMGITPHKKDGSALSRNIRAAELEPKIDEFMNIVRQLVKSISDKKE